MNVKARFSRFLIINPNSSQSVTDNLKDILPTPPATHLTFYTGPPNAPPEIDGPETSRESTEACLPDLLAHHVDHYDGYLVCCYSDHPLIYELRKHTSKPVLGIFQATVTYAVTKSPEKFGILTSTGSWEPILDIAVDDFFGAKVPLFTGTVASNIEVLKLSDPKYFKELVARARICVDAGAKTVLLGCAGLSGLEGKLEAEFPGVRFIDSVKIGSELLNALVRFDTE